MQGFQFQYEAGGVWCSVSSEANDYYWTSYLAYLQGDETVAQVESGAAKYHINFASMEQTNVETSTKPKI